MWQNEVYMEELKSDEEYPNGQQIGTNLRAHNCEEMEVVEISSDYESGQSSGPPYPLIRGTHLFNKQLFAQCQSIDKIQNDETIVNYIGIPINSSNPNIIIPEETDRTNFGYGCSYHPESSSATPRSESLTSVTTKCPHQSSLSDDSEMIVPQSGHSFGLITETKTSLTTNLLNQLFAQNVDVINNALQNAPPQRVANGTLGPEMLNVDALTPVQWQAFWHAYMAIYDAGELPTRILCHLCSGPVEFGTNIGTKPMQTLTNLSKFILNSPNLNAAVTTNENAFNINLHSTTDKNTDKDCNDNRVDQKIRVIDIPSFAMPNPSRALTRKRQARRHLTVFHKCGRF